MILANQNDMAPYLFRQGANTCSYEYLGAHTVRDADGYRTVFRVWAPNAKAVSLVGDFNGWRDGENPMAFDEPSGT